MTSCHLVTRAQEHLRYFQHLTKLLLHNIFICICLVIAITLGLVSLKYLTQCHNDYNYETKIQEALPIKELKPKFNTQLYANSRSFFLNVFWCMDGLPSLRLCCS